MVIFTAVSKTWEVHLWWVCLEEEKSSTPTAFTIWAACLQNRNEDKWTGSISPVLSPWKLSGGSKSGKSCRIVKYIRTGHASVSWRTFLTPGTCLRWRMACRAAASTRPPLHNNEVKNKSYSSRKALSSWTYFFLLDFPELPLTVDFISDHQTHTAVSQHSSEREQ